MNGKLNARSDVTMFALEIANRTRWVASKSFSGGPVDGIDGLNFGILPEYFREFVKDATYAVYSYETPIVVQVGGKWLVPDAGYGPTTGKHVTAITRALDSIGAAWEKIPGPDGKRIKVNR